MMTQTNVKQEVREFYNQVGWQEVGEGLYQNAHYEDLRPVAREYIHRCHLRVARHLKPEGRALLDAGSGPIQYPEYLEYSRNYRYRVCADISSVALQEARKRIGDHGLYVVCDIANLPFKPETFESVVSLHTIHHLPNDEHLQAYREIYRVLASGGSAAVVNGWPSSRLMSLAEPFIRLSNRVRGLSRRLSGQRNSEQYNPPRKEKTGRTARAGDESQPKGTFTKRRDVHWIKTVVGGQMPAEIFVWRSASVRFLRALIHPRLGGRALLRLLYSLEERFPHYFGENGQYPLVVIKKGNPQISE